MSRIYTVLAISWDVLAIRDCWLTMDGLKLLMWLSLKTCLQILNPLKIFFSNQDKCPASSFVSDIRCISFKNIKCSINGHISFFILRCQYRIGNTYSSKGWSLKSTFCKNFAWLLDKIEFYKKIDHKIYPILKIATFSAFDSLIWKMI